MSQRQLWSGALTRKKRAFVFVFGAAFLTFAVPRTTRSQVRVDLGGFLQVGGEGERYLRVLQIAGLVPLVPWSIQPFSPTQASKLRPTRPHPWSARVDSSNGAAIGEGFHVLRPKERVVANSTFPFQDGGGPTWAGRGFTGELQAGIDGSWKILSGQLAPLAFIAQNSAFPLAPNGTTGDEQFADPRFPVNIDAPQRFGTKAYRRIGSGASFLTVDEGHVTASVISAPQQWGPARDYPLVLGPNGGGFPSIIAGTSTPVDLWLVNVHARVLYGDLGQSEFSPVADGERRRLGSGVVGVMGIRGLSGLELGGTRFIHAPWPDQLTWGVIRHPLFAGVNLTGNTQNPIEENQVASLFVRWAFPSAGAEFYGEMYREDYPGRFHQALSLVEKPDDLASFTLGFQRVLSIGDQHARVIRGELVNGETSHQERGARGFVYPIPPYIHSGVLQGHTVNGLFLGSPEAYGGAAWRLGYDDYSTSGRLSLSLERALRFDWLPTIPVTQSPRHPDVIYALRADLLRFYGRRDLTITLIPSLDLNRNLVANNDVFNLTASVTVRGWP